MPEIISQSSGKYWSDHIVLTHIGVYGWTKQFIFIYHSCFYNKSGCWLNLNQAMVYLPLWTQLIEESSLHSERYDRQSFPGNFQNEHKRIIVRFGCQVFRDGQSKYVPPKIAFTPNLYIFTTNMYLTETVLDVSHNKPCRTDILFISC